MTDSFNESTVEAAALSWFEDLDYTVLHGPHIAPGEPAAEREAFSDVVLVRRLRDAINRLNPDIPHEAREDALRKVLRPESPSLIGNNRTFHRRLRGSVVVEYPRPDGSIAGDNVWLVDYRNPADNDWLVVNQFAVIEGQHHRRPDLVVFVNGLPVGVIELKSATAENADIWTAFNQLQTYQWQIPSLFHYNEVQVVSDGLQARIGSLTASREWFKVWRTIEGDVDAPASAVELETLIRGVFQPERFLALLRHFIVFEEEQRREKLKTRWAALEALVGAPKRIKLIARDLVDHFEHRLEGMDGKAMVVCMSRRICVDLYNEIIALRPDWHRDDDEQGVVKIVMTGSAGDAPEWQPHIRNKPRRKALATRFKNTGDPFKIVIVRDMWLTGFDAPCLHTMYVDKPMRGHGLMQAIARVNRVFRDKPGGLVVDYLGLADQLKHALRTYTESGGAGKPSIDMAEAVAVLKEKHEICCGIMHGLDWSDWTTGTPAERLRLLPQAQEHVLEQEDGKNRFTRAVADLSKAFALCAGEEEARELRDDIAFFQAIRTALGRPAGQQRSQDELDHAIRQLVSKAVVADGQVIDVFTSAGLNRPDISILSDQFLAEVRALPTKNVAAETLARLLGDEIRTRSSRNVVQSRRFSEMLKRTMNAYHNRAIATHEIIEELINLAREIRDAADRGEDLGLNDDELAFYDALAQNESAVQAMGIDELKVIAAELVTKVRGSVTIDWTVRESARAKIRVMVRRILNKFGYPPDLREEAVKLVLEQAETLCAEWAE